MRCGGVRRAFCAPMRLSHLSQVVAAALLAALAAGCSSQQTTRLVSMNAAASANPTVTFESIDGPPPEVFRKLVASLNDEASARQVAVVPRQAAATYRVRGYITALVDRDKTSFAWVWDVYDGDKRRALRITGEEPAAPASRGRNARVRDAWTSADAQVLRGISRAGMERIATFLNAPSPSGPAPTLAPGPTLPTLVSSQDDSPEAAGIFRVFGGSGPQNAPRGEPQADPPQAEPPQADPPKPPAPANAAKRRSAAVKPATQSAALDQ
jgi:uncharacterized lipoprotein YmbA